MEQNQIEIIEKQHNKKSNLMKSSQTENILAKTKIMNVIKINLANHNSSKYSEEKGRKLNLK